MKYRQQTYTVTEIDTDTNTVRIITAWTKNLGTGNSQRKKTKQEELTSEIKVQEL